MVIEVSLLECLIERPAVHPLTLKEGAVVLKFEDGFGGRTGVSGFVCCDAYRSCGRMEPCRMNHEAQTHLARRKSR